MSCFHLLHHDPFDSFATTLRKKAWQSFGISNSSCGFIGALLVAMELASLGGHQVIKTFAQQVAVHLAKTTNRHHKSPWPDPSSQKSAEERHDVQNGCWCVGAKSWYLLPWWCHQCSRDVLPKRRQLKPAVPRHGVAVQPAQRWHGKWREVLHVGQNAHLLRQIGCPAVPTAIVPKDGSSWKDIGDLGFSYQLCGYLLSIGCNWGGPTCPAGMGHKVLKSIQSGSSP